MQNHLTKFRQKLKIEKAVCYTEFKNNVRQNHSQTFTAARSCLPTGLFLPAYILYILCIAFSLVYLCQHKYVFCPLCFCLVSVGNGSTVNEAEHLPSCTIAFLQSFWDSVHTQSMSHCRVHHGLLEKIKTFKCT